MKELIGKKIKGFKFKAEKKIAYPPDMDNYIDKIGVIIDVDGNEVEVEFVDDNWHYPLPEALNHILPERGDDVLVWDVNESKADKRIFLAYIEGAESPIVCVHISDEYKYKNGGGFLLCNYKNCKPVPQKTKLTMQQIADKFGIDVNDLEVEI